MTTKFLLLALAARFMLIMLDDHLEKGIELKMPATTYKAYPQYVGAVEQGLRSY